MYELTNIQVTEGGVTEPVALIETKAWIEVDFDEKDSLITSMIMGARKTVEQTLNLALVEKTITFDVDLCKLEIITLPYTKNITALTVKKLNDVDEETTLTVNVHYFIRGNRLRMITEGRFVISYKTVPVVNEDIKEAIKMEVAERYQNRGENQAMRANYDAPSLGLSEPAKAKLQPYIVSWL